MSGGTSSKTRPAPAEGGGAIGYWADESVPDLRDLLTAFGIDVQAFAAWLGPRLGTFRGAAVVQVAMPTPEAERDHLVELLANVRAVEQGLRTIPPRSSATISLISHRHQTDWHELQRRAGQDLLLLLWHLEQARKAIAVPKRGPGRKQSTDRRDALIAEVVAKLREAAPACKLEALRDLAREILLRCGVRPPSDVKRATRRGQK